MVRGLLITLAFVLCAGGAWGHAFLVSADPPDGATLVEPPRQAVLRFSEPVSPIAIKLLDDTGAAVPLPVMGSQAEAIRVALPEQMRQGTYLLSYRVRSADSHPVSGSTAFSIGSATRQAHPVGQSSTPDLGVWQVVLRALRDFALLVAAGAALFLLCVGRFRGERVVLALMGSVAAVLGIAGVGVQGVALLGYGNLFDAEVWRAGIRSSYGLSATVATAAALSIAAAAALRRGALRSSLLALGAFGIAVSLPLTGHAATANPRSLALIAITSHVLAAAFWTGSLVALLSLLRERSVDTVSALQRFSQLATWGVALLFAAGAAFAAMQLASPGELLHSRYGNLILGKTALFALLLALAAYNRFVLVAAMKHGGSRAVALRASITTEIAIIVAVVAVTAILTQTSPQAQQTVYPLSAVSHSGTMTVVPGRAGRNVIAVRFRDKDGKAFYPEEAVLDLANAAAGVEPITRPLIRSEQGDYRYEGRELAFAGRWSYEITMRINAFEQVDFTGSIEIE